MNLERYCAEQIRLREAETFLAVSHTAGARFDPRFNQSRSQGQALRLPDLFSVVAKNGRPHFRIREVKFKLEQRLVVKALTQLEMGVNQLLSQNSENDIDRLEIVVPLRGRELKQEEKSFFGEPLEPNRYALVVDHKNARITHGDRSYEVTVLVI